MTPKLSDRINNYIAHSNFKLINKLPVIINVNGRSFSKTTALLDKPYSLPFMEALTATASHLIQEIDGVVFAYIFNDEIILLTRNDQNPDTTAWCDNNVQRIVSSVASISSLYFNNYAASINLDIAEAIFTTTTFVVPNMTEATNTLICKQQQNLQSSVQLACFYNLLKKGMNKNVIKEMTSGLDREEKINLLEQECKVNFNEYPTGFKHGVACYKKSYITEYEGQEIIKYKWYLDVELPIFSSHKEFLQDILKTKDQI